MSVPTTKSIIRQRPRLLYAGLNDNGVGWIADAHESENVEFWLISKGSGKTEVGNVAYPFTAGDFLVFNRGCVHREYLDALSEREVMFVGVGNLHIYGLENESLLKDKDFCLVHSGAYLPTLRNYMLQLLAETEGTQPLREEISASLLKILLLFAVRLVGFDANATFRENTSYLEAKRYFDEHFLEIDSIDSVCKSLYVNKYYLSHIFSQNIGIPPLRYLINKRIDLACHYLETTEDNVADVGKRCGYPDPCYFSRTFKKVKGITPLRYRFLFKKEKRRREKEEAEARKAKLAAESANETASAGKQMK